MKEVDIQKGTITREDMHGNEEADKRATLGVEMHKVPPHLDVAVDQQDALVKKLLTMMLSIMERVHDKAPPRKKEDKATQDEAQRKFQGPKTGPHGEHDFVTKEGG
eukprot:2192732-Heterocapsa_arctica.AAC.3